MIFMYNLEIYKINENSASIEQLPIKRDWMEETTDQHAYKCFPVSLTNRMGWGISFPEDIVFKWDGVSDTFPHHVKIISGHKYVYTERANATISFKTGLVFKTLENISLLHMPTPNLFINGITPFTTLISTSFFKGELPSAAKILNPNVEIIIKANTPYATIIPISLSHLQNSTANIYNYNQIPQNFFPDTTGYSEKVVELNRLGKWSNFYRDAVNHKNESIGQHEVKAIRLNTIRNYT